MGKLKNPKQFFKNATFIKASGSRTGGGGDVCVQVAKKEGFIGIRDSKNPTGPVLAFTSEEWKAFTDGVKAGEFN